MALSDFEKLVMSGSYVQVAYDSRHGMFTVRWYLDNDNVHMSLTRSWSEQLSRSIAASLLQATARNMNEEIMRFDMESEVRRSNDANPPWDHPQNPDAEPV